MLLLAVASSSFFIFRIFYLFFSLARKQYPFRYSFGTEVDELSVGGTWQVDAAGLAGGVFCVFSGGAYPGGLLAGGVGGPKVQPATG